MIVNEFLMWGVILGGLMGWGFAFWFHFRYRVAKEAAKHLLRMLVEATERMAPPPIRIVSTGNPWEDFRRAFDEAVIGKHEEDWDEVLSEKEK